MTMKTLFCTSALCALLASASFASAQQKTELLFATKLDMNQNGVPDTAALVLVGPGRDAAAQISPEFHILSEGERVDLYIYLDSGEAAADISTPPTASRENIFDGAPTGWIYAPSAIGKGSLKLESASSPGSSNSYGETLTVVYRKGAFLVGGLDKDWDTRNYLGGCHFNMLTGKAYRQDGLQDAPLKPLKVKLKPVPLADWSAKTRPAQCD